MTVTAKVVLRDAALIYGFTFAAGFGMAVVGVSLENNPSTTYTANLLSGALGFSVAGIRRSRNRTEHLAWVAATVWVFNLAHIALGIQTTASWIRSGLTLILMATLGGMFATVLTLASSPHRRTDAGPDGGQPGGSTPAYIKRRV